MLCFLLGLVVFCLGLFVVSLIGACVLAIGSYWPQGDEWIDALLTGLLVCLGIPSALLAIYALGCFMRRLL
jgi:hypothetical protein